MQYWTAWMWTISTRWHLPAKQIRDWILETPLPPKLTDDIVAAWDEMRNGSDITVAVRSSATAEDLPDASFAGQQETFSKY